MGFGTSKQSANNSSQQTSQSSNQAFPSLQASLGSQVDNVGKGSNAIMSLLGLNGDQAGIDGFNKFRDSSSYKFLQSEGIKGVEGSQAARGMLNSGATLKGLSNFSNNLATNFLDKYLANLKGISDTGLGAANVLGGAGNTSTSQGTSTGKSSGKSTNFTFG